MTARRLLLHTHTHYTHAHAQSKKYLYWTKQGKLYSNSIVGRAWASIETAKITLGIEWRVHNIYGGENQYSLCKITAGYKAFDDMYVHAGVHQILQTREHVTL